MTPTVYLAARFSRRAELQGYVPLFERAGFEVTSRWITTKQHVDTLGISQEEYDADPHADRVNEMSEAHQRDVAEMDLEDVARAQAFVAFTEPPAGPAGSRGGRHVEYGYALGLNKTIIICGPREAFFYMLDRPNIVQVSSPEWAAEALWARAQLGKFNDPPEPVYSYSTEHGLRQVGYGRRP